MPLRVLITPDKFKGTLSAAGAVRAIATGWAEERPEDKLVQLPMSDGGDGFGEVIGDLIGAERRCCETIDSTHRPCAAGYGYAQQGATAVIESAEFVGLARLRGQRVHPFQQDTFGLGKVLKDAQSAGAQQIIVGLGGSATNDAGFGLARSLGYTFWDRRGHEIDRWTELAGLARLVRPTPCAALPTVVAAVDVSNPLLGPRGASRMFGGQKGLVGDDFVRAEQCHARMVEVAADTFGVDGDVPGAGAAGGLGFALRMFAGATLRLGAELFSELSQLPLRIQGCDLVITGEGKFDQQSAMGKGVGMVARAAALANKPCICLAGVSELEQPVDFGSRFYLRSIVPSLADTERALSDAQGCLRRLAAESARTVADVNVS